MDILLTFELYNKRQLTHVSPGEEGKGCRKHCKVKGYGILHAGDSRSKMFFRLQL